MIFIELFSFLVYLSFILITGYGIVSLFKLNREKGEDFFTAFLTGTFFTGNLIFIIYAFFDIGPKDILILLIAAPFFAKGLLAALPGASSMRQTASGKLDILKRYFAERRALFTLIVIYMLLLIIFAATPIRAADAVRYHAAQIKDIIYNNKLIFRPYLAYNFPHFLQMLFMPLMKITAGDGANIQLFILFYAVMLLALIGRAYFPRHREKFSILAVLYLTMPYVVQYATSYFNDIPLIFYLFLSLYFFREAGKSKAFLQLGFLSYGLCWGIKYLAMAFAPLVIIELYKLWRKDRTMLRSFLPGILLFSIAAGPTYVFNMINSSNPFWPFFYKFFPAANDSVYKMLTSTWSDTASFKYNLPAMLATIRDIITYNGQSPLILLLLAAGIIFYFKRFRPEIAGIALFFLTLFLFEPQIYPRYSMFIFPLFIVIATETYFHLSQKKNFIRIAAVTGFFVYALLFAGFYMYYGMDFIKYHITQNSKDYHRFTWYHDVFSDLNKVPDRGAVLVIAQCSQTYYLDQPYLAGDNLSGLIDWKSIKEKDLKEFLKTNGIKYIVWDTGLFHDGIKNALSPFLKRQDLVRRYNTRLYTQRVNRTYTDSEVLVIRVPQENV